MNLMNQDNLVHTTLNRIGDIVIANLLFILCAAPIITIGPALTALYHCTLRTVKGNQNGTVKTFFKAFRQNFVQSLTVWGGICTFGAVLFLNLQFLRRITGPAGQLLFYLSGALMVLLVIATLYIFPVIAAFANTTKNLLKNALLFAAMHFVSTIAMAVISLLPMYMTFQDVRLLPLYSCCWFFFGFGLTAYLNSLMMYRIFKPYLDEK